MDFGFHDLIERFRLQEEISSNHGCSLSADELTYEQHFYEMDRRAPDWRYVLRSPFKKDILLLGDSSSSARSLLVKMKQRLGRPPAFKVLFHKFMQEYIELSPMCPSPKFLTTLKDRKSFFLPHHGVFKVIDTKEKLHVVFNASVRLRGGLSLNERRHLEPKLQNDISDALLRWRVHCFVFATFIEKIYQQIVNAIEDRQYQQIYWWNNP